MDSFNFKRIKTLDQFYTEVSKVVGFNFSDRLKASVDNVPNAEKYVKFSFDNQEIMTEIISFFMNPTPEIRAFFNKPFDRDTAKNYILRENPFAKPYLLKSKMRYELMKHPYEETKGVYKCRNQKCGSENTVSAQMQLRAADEGMNTFVHCASCGKDYVI